MADARIYSPARSAQQSGRAKTQYWVLEMEPKARRNADRLIGWLGSGDTEQQVSLKFPTKDAATAYAERHGITFQLFEPHERIVKPKSYSDNFTRRV